jgi:hypothetical protein
MAHARAALLSIVMLLLFAGCYSSEIALDQPDDLKADPRLAGDWSFPAAGKLKAFTVSVRPRDDQRSYDVEWTDGDKHLRGVAVIIPIKNVNFVQIRPQTPAGDPPSQERLMLRISIKDDKLGIQQLNPYFFYTKRLTAPDHLQDLLERNVDNSEMYQGDWRYGTRSNP